MTGCSLRQRGGQIGFERLQRLFERAAQRADGGGGASYLRLPATMARRTPSRVKLLAKRQFCVSTRSKRENTGLDRLESQAQRLPERGDMRPLTRTSGIFLSLASTIRFGQNSDLVKSAAQKPHVAHPQRLQTNAKSKAMLGFTRPPYPLIV